MSLELGRSAHATRAGREPSTREEGGRRTHCDVLDPRRRFSPSSAARRPRRSNHRPPAVVDPLALRSRASPSAGRLASDPWRANGSRCCCWGRSSGGGVTADDDEAEAEPPPPTPRSDSAWADILRERGIRGEVRPESSVSAGRRGRRGTTVRGGSGSSLGKSSGLPAPTHRRGRRPRSTRPRARCGRGRW